MFKNSVDSHLTALVESVCFKIELKQYGIANRYHFHDKCTQRYKRNRYKKQIIELIMKYCFLLYNLGLYSVTSVSTRLLPQFNHIAINIILIKKC